MIAIFDIGKTNKKLSVLNNSYEFIFENAVRIPDIKDEDGDDCDDLASLTTWIKQSFQELVQNKKFNITALNFSGFGASIVFIDEKNNPAAPLYSYLKPLPKSLHKKFYSDYGGEEHIARVTASPVLGSLNSGLQVYRMKHLHPEKFDSFTYTLHFPQYLSLLFTNQPCSEKTSIGCHTHLWDFTTNSYHQWVSDENILKKLAPIVPCDSTFEINTGRSVISTGIGLHDSSSALIPYLTCCTEPFVLISTGTWCITLNPFNQSPLTLDELKQDCLCYLSHEGKAVKSARLFAGHWHEVETQRMAAHYNVSASYYKTVAFDNTLLTDFKGERSANNSIPVNQAGLDFARSELSQFSSYEAAYHALMCEIIYRQVQSSNLVLKNSSVKNIYVDGGFSNNPIYMKLLASNYQHYNVYSASVPQASTIGAAMIIHSKWNPTEIPKDFIRLTSH